MSNDLIGTVKGQNLELPDYPSQMLSNEDSTGTGIPGWILQGDVLQALGPAITVRSDTFRIRAYGETRDPANDQVAARTWCEAIVQRIPEPADGSTKIEELIEPSSLFGRGFRILSFRWLSPEDV